MWSRGVVLPAPEKRGAELEQPPPNPLLEGGGAGGTRAKGGDHTVRRSAGPDAPRKSARNHKEKRRPYVSIQPPGGRKREPVSRPRFEVSRATNVIALSMYRSKGAGVRLRFWAELRMLGRTAYRSRPACAAAERDCAKMNGAKALFCAFETRRETKNAPHGRGVPRSHLDPELSRGASRGP